MKILTDWLEGPPPCPGWWIVSRRERSKDFGGALILITHEVFFSKRGKRWWKLHQYRGLAFDPNTVKFVYDGTQP